MNTILYLLDDNFFQEIEIENIHADSTAALKQIASKLSSEYFLLKVKQGKVELDSIKIKEWLLFAETNKIDFSYSDFYQEQNKVKEPNPTINYTIGSIRDDFNFGALVLIKRELFQSYIETIETEYKYAGWYHFRLFASRKSTIHKYDDFCYTYSETDLRQSGQKQFDYVNPNNRERQIEMEFVASEHLKKIGAFLYAPFKTIDINSVDFETTASVIIPVLNREKTISDAIASVLNQQTNFKFNLIIVNNHSTDNTSTIIESINDDRIIHHIPVQTNLGIGGCWNEGIHHPKCGKFVVQLDSDDLYRGENTLQLIIDKFLEEKCAMVIGSYQMVNFKLEEIPPGVIDHREWTAENGPNNALRINGLGAPRAFYTPVIREIGFPNVSYGEDYAVGLAISREYKVGRIYEPIYLCRRWDDNTDANLSVEKINAHNIFKDELRKKEIELRITKLQKKN